MPNQCCPNQMIISNISEQLDCIICYQIMTVPIKTSCGHIFGKQCLEKWIKKKQLSCPVCRNINFKMQKDVGLTAIISKLKAACQFCQWHGSPINLYSHLQCCAGIQEKTRLKLQELVNKMQQTLKIQINPHLKNNHLDIYIKYVQDWNWLGYDHRDWKWWWWSFQPWWNDHACQQCNKLWHKYESIINPLQIQRIDILDFFNKDPISDLHYLFEM